MAVYREEPVETEVVRSGGGSGMAGFAFAKYGFMFLIVLVILGFIGRYLMHLF